MTNLSDLIERVEAASEDDQYDVLVATFQAIKGPIRITPRPGIICWHDDWFVFERKLKAFAYLDAAMTLVPESWSLDLRTFSTAKGATVSLHPETTRPSVSAKAATLALALVAASLRALKEQANG